VRRLLESASSTKEGSYQAHKEKNNEHKEANPRDFRRGEGYNAEAKNTRDQRNYQKNQRVVKHRNYLHWSGLNPPLSTEHVSCQGLEITGSNQWKYLTVKG